MSSNALEKRLEDVCLELRVINHEMQSFLDRRSKASEEPGRLQSLKEQHDRLLGELNELTEKLENTKTL